MLWVRTKIPQDVVLVKGFNLLFKAKNLRDFKKDIVPNPVLAVLSFPTLPPS
jgi:hypothetical protein